MAQMLYFITALDMIKKHPNLTLDEICRLTNLNLQTLISLSIARIFQDLDLNLRKDYLEDFSKALRLIEEYGIKTKGDRKIFDQVSIAIFRQLPYKELYLKLFLYLVTLVSDELELGTEKCDKILETLFQKLVFIQHQNKELDQEYVKNFDEDLISIEPGQNEFIIQNEHIEVYSERVKERIGRSAELYRRLREEYVKMIAA